MKKILTFLITLILMVSINPVFASAKTINAGIGPNNFFYFFDIVFEEINLFFTFNVEKKAKISLKYADERIAELAEISKNKTPTIYTETVNRYQKQISYAKEISVNIKQSEKKKNILTLITKKEKNNSNIIPFVVTDENVKILEILDNDVEEVKSVDVEEAQKPKIKKESKQKAVQQVKKPIVTKIEPKNNTDDKELEKLRAEVEEMKKEAEEKNSELEQVYETLTASCKPKRDIIVVTKPVQWSVDIRGGNSPYTIKWSGSDNLTGNSEYVTKSYSIHSSEYTSTAFVSISSNDGQNATANCSVKIIPETVIETTSEPKKEIEPKLSYNDLNCPKVTKLEDNQGNVKINSNTLKGSISASQIDTLRVIVTAEDPNGDIIKYRYSPSRFSKNNPKINFWLEDNEYEILGSNLLVGGNRTLFVALNDEDDYSCIGANYDIPVKFIYDIAP